MRIFFFAVLPWMLSCSPSKPNPSSYEFEDLVLIEFAARLEEDYHKMHPIKDGSSIKNKAPLQYEDPAMMQISPEEPHLMDEK